MGLLGVARSLSGIEPFSSQSKLYSPVPLLVPVAACLSYRLLLASSKYSKTESSEMIVSTDSWLSTDFVFGLLPRWRLHLDVFRRWLPGYLFGCGGKDPTTGKPRSYWSYRADAYEQMCPKFSLAHIARWFDVKAWKGQLTAKLDDAVNNSASKQADDLCGSIERLLSAKACSSGNSVRTPVDGNQAFEWRRRLIQGAKKRVLFMSAYMSVDVDARAIAEDLADCVKRGVECYVALDNFGADAFVFCGVDPRYKEDDKETTFEYADLVRTLRDAGVKICFWRAADCLHARDAASGASGNYELYDCKNHIKSIIVDNEVCLLTDRNMGAPYFRNPAYSSTEVVLAGPCVQEMEAKWVELWAAGGGLEPLAVSPPKSDSPASSSKLFASLSDSPADNTDRLFTDAWGAVMFSTPKTLESGVDPVLMSLILGIRAAKESVDLMFAYMEICQPLRAELEAALRRGVKIRVVTNSRETNDLFWINSAFLKSVLPVVDLGGKLVMAVCSPEGAGHVHAKVAVVDRRYLLVGSWNAWLRSTLYEVEADVLLDSPALASSVARGIDTLEASAAYQEFDRSQIEVELAEDPLGLDPDVAPFL